MQAEKQPEKWRALTTARNTSLHKDEIPHVNLSTSALLDEFNFVLVRCIPRFRFPKICFEDEKRIKLVYLAGNGTTLNYFELKTKSLTTFFN